MVILPAGMSPMDTSKKTTGLPFVPAPGMAVDCFDMVAHWRFSRFKRSSLPCQVTQCSPFLCDASRTSTQARSMKHEVEQLDHKLFILFEVSSVEKKELIRYIHGRGTGTVYSPTKGAPPPN